MKILIDGRGIKNTGIGRYIENTLREILKLDKQNKYVLLLKPADKPSLKIKAENLELLEADIEWYGVKEQTELLKIIKSEHPDLVHFTNFNFPVAYKGNFVITIHDLTLLHFKNLRSSLVDKALYILKDQIMRNLVLRRGIANSKAVLVPTEYVKQDVAKTFGVKKNKITVTYEAADSNFAKPAVNLTKYGVTKPFVLYVGNAYPHKNLERMIMAFGELVTKYVLDYQLVIAGKKDSFHEVLERAVEESNLTDRVIFTDYVSDTELAGFYKKASLYVFPSLSEGFGLPPLEAMAHGLPVASSDSTCLPEILGDAAVYFNPKNIKDISSTMLSVLTDSKLSNELSKKGLSQVKKYSWRKTAQLTLQTYNRSLKVK